MGPFSVSTPDANNNDNNNNNNNNNNNIELSNEPLSHLLTFHPSSTSTGTENRSMSISSSRSSISSSSLPPYSELVKELGTL